MFSSPLRIKFVLYCRQAITEPDDVGGLHQVVCGADWSLWGVHPHSTRREENLQGECDTDGC